MNWMFPGIALYCVMQDINDIHKQKWGTVVKHPLRQPDGMHVWGTSGS